MYKKGDEERGSFKEEVKALDYYATEAPLTTST